MSLHSTASMWDPRGFITKEIDRLESLAKTRPKSIIDTSCTLGGVKWDRQKGWTYRTTLPPTLMSWNQYRSLTKAGTEMRISGYFVHDGRRLRPEKMSMFGEMVTDVEVQKESKFLPFNNQDNLDPSKLAKLLSLALRHYGIHSTCLDESFVWQNDGRVLYIDGRLHGHLCLEDTCPICRTD